MKLKIIKTKIKQKLKIQSSGFVGNFPCNSLSIYAGSDFSFDSIKWKWFNFKYNHFFFFHFILLQLYFAAKSQFYIQIGSALSVVLSYASMHINFSSMISSSFSFVVYYILFYHIPRATFLPALDSANINFHCSFAGKYQFRTVI